MKKGFTLIELLVSSAIALVILGFFVQQLSFTSKVYIDNNMMQTTHNQAQAILNLIGIDMRMIGNGLPFEVANFNVGDELLDEAGIPSSPDITHPILVASNGTAIHYRLNETGSVYMTTADFAFNTTEFTINLHDVDGLFVGDPVYITNKSLAAQEAFWGVIKDANDGIDVGNNRIKIDVTNNGYWVSQVNGFTGFEKGSILEPVADISLINTVIGGRNYITRQINDTTPLELARNATFTATYYTFTQDENEITLVPIPTITEAILISHGLKFIEITVNVTSDKNLSVLGNVGSPYVASISQIFAVKNLRAKS